MSCVCAEMMLRGWAGLDLHTHWAEERLSAALSGTSASLIFPAGVAAVSSKKEILPLSLSPEIWKQHCASKAMTVIPPVVCSAPHLLYQPLGNSRGRLLPWEGSCRVGGFHYTCSSGNNYHIVLNFITLGCSLHTRTNASASLLSVVRSSAACTLLKVLFVNLTHVMDANPRIFC